MKETLGNTTALDDDIYLVESYKDTGTALADIESEINKALNRNSSQTKQLKKVINHFMFRWCNSRRN